MICKYSNLATQRTAQTCIGYWSGSCCENIQLKMFRKLEPSCNFDNHDSIFGKSSGLSYSLSHVDLSQKLEYNGGSNQQNNCSKQVKRATSYLDLSMFGKESYQGKIDGPYSVYKNSVMDNWTNYCFRRPALKTICIARMFSSEQRQILNLI